MHAHIITSQKMHMPRHAKGLSVSIIICIYLYTSEVAIYDWSWVDTAWETSMAFLVEVFPYEHTKKVSMS
jgi:hypothetical protein